MKIDGALRNKLDRGLDGDLSEFTNKHITDQGWSLLIAEITNLESICKPVLGELFVHVNWPFIAGISHYPILSYQMTKMIVDLGKNQSTKT